MSVEDESIITTADKIKFDLTESGELSDKLAEPIAPDVRDKCDGKNRALVKFVAGLLGVGFDESILALRVYQKSKVDLFAVNELKK